MPVTLLLADDHPIIHQGLRTLLQTEADFTIVGETGDGLEAVRLAECLLPNVVVLDLMMPSLNGLEVVRQIAKRVPQTRTLVLSMHETEAYVLQALRNGASGYVVKNSAPAILVQAIKEVAAGRRYLCPCFCERAIDVYMQKAENATLDLHETLTTREREVLQLVAEGHSNAEIAKRLFISPRTVEVHRANLMRKLDLRTSADLFRYALKRGIVPHDSLPPPS